MPRAVARAKPSRPELTNHVAIFDDRVSRSDACWPIMPTVFLIGCLSLLSREFPDPVLCSDIRDVHAQVDCATTIPSLSATRPTRIMAYGACAQL